MVWFKKVRAPIRQCKSSDLPSVSVATVSCCIDGLNNMTRRAWVIFLIAVAAVFAVLEVYALRTGTPTLLQALVWIIVPAAFALYVAIAWVAVRNRKWK